MARCQLKLSPPFFLLVRPETSACITLLNSTQERIGMGDVVTMFDEEEDEEICGVLTAVRSYDFFAPPIGQKFNCANKMAFVLQHPIWSQLQPWTKLFPS